MSSVPPLEVLLQVRRTEARYLANQRVNENNHRRLMEAFQSDANAAKNRMEAIDGLIMAYYGEDGVNALREAKNPEA